MRVNGAASSGLFPYAPQCRLYAPVSASNTITRRFPYPSATKTSLDGAYTAMPAALFTFAVSLLPPVVPWRPICNRNLPDLVNLRRLVSFSPLPEIQTLSFWSTKIPCSVSGQSYPCPAPPQDWTRLPAWSNSKTGGAGVQQSAVLSRR